MKDIELPEPAAFFLRLGRLTRLASELPERFRPDTGETDQWFDAERHPLFTADQLRAAIEADRAQRVLDGWKWVPVDPTKEMLHCGPEPKNDAEKFAADMAAGYRKDIWTAMLASTPAQPAQQEAAMQKLVEMSEDLGLYDQPEQRKPMAECVHHYVRDSEHILHECCQKCGHVKTASGSNHHVC